MKKKQKTTAEVQAAIFRREHRKSPLRGGVKLTLKKARELALQEFGTAKGIQQEENTLPDYYIMRLGNMRVRIAPDTYGGTGCILIEVRLSGYGRAFQLHDPETLQEDFEAEEQRLRKERREALQDWVGTNGVEACRAEVEKIWNGGVKHRPRRRSPLPFLLLAVAVVGCAFAVAVAAVVPMEADSHGGQDQALPTPTLEEAERDKLDAPAAATPTPTPAPYIPDEAEVEMLARLIWGEARGIPSDMHKAAVVWCALNRVDAEGWPDTVAEVVTQPHQFAGYSPDYPATEEFKAIAADVLIRWEREKREGGEVGRVLPAEYVFFTGDGEVNHFRTEYEGGMFWDWSLKNPYSS